MTTRHYQDRYSLLAQKEGIGGTQGTLGRVHRVKANFLGSAVRGEMCGRAACGPRGAAWGRARGTACATLLVSLVLLQRMRVRKRF